MATSLSLSSPDISKKRRRPAGTPDPDAEVVSLPPQTLLESDRFVCEICNQGFQREQNLQMHRRRHKVPWKLLKKEGSVPAGEARKRVYVCPEPSCLHHDPAHALGDLVGIKKHYRRKHSDRRQWVCERCDKGYAVQSDYKAHLKTCGTRGHTCDCGRVFSRVESFIEHQDGCIARGHCLSRTGSSSSPSPETDSASPNLELQLLPTFTPNTTTTVTPSISPDDANATELQLSLSPYGGAHQNQLKMAAAEKALADEARRLANRQLELAQQEFANAMRIRQQAQAELDKAYMLRNNAAKSINSTLLQVTCCECKKMLRVGESSLPVSAVTDSRNSV